MAKTYIGYAQREKETNVNWGAVATGFTDLLNEQRKTKEENEAADALATQKLATTLQNSPEGGDRESSDYILDYVNNASNYNLMLKRQLDAGNMSRKQFTTLTQNLTNGTAQIVAITKKYNTYLQNQEKRMKEATDIGGQAAQDVWNAGKIQSFADFRDNAAFIDPTTMKVSQGKLVDKVVDGKTIRVMSDNTADFTQVSTMLGWMGQEIDKFDLNKAIDDTYKTLAPSYQTNMLDGSIKDDVRRMPDFQKSVNGKLKSYLNDPRNVASVLADYAQMAPKGGTDGAPTPWEFTDDVKKANNKNAIYLTPDSAGNYNIDLDSKQGQYLQEQALEYMNSQLELKIPRKTTAIPQAPPPKAITPEQIGSMNNVTAILQVAYGNKEERAAGSAQILALNDGYRKVSANQDNTAINITTNDNVVFSIPFNSNPNMLLQGAGKVIGTDVSYKNSLSLMQQNDPTTYNNLYKNQLSNSTDVNMEDFSTIPTRDKKGAYNVLKINTGKTKEVENEDGVKRIITITETPFEMFNQALGNSLRGYDAELTKMVPVMEEIFKKSGISSLVNDQNLFTVIDDDDKNDGKLQLNEYVDAIGNVSPSLLKIYLPEVMNGPIYLLQEDNQEENVSRINKITKTLYDAANEGRKLSPNDFGFMQNSVDRTVNEGAYKYEENNASFVIPGSKVKFLWNGGDGSKFENAQIKNNQGQYMQVRDDDGNIITINKDNEVVVEVKEKATVDSKGKWNIYNKPTEGN